MLTETRAKCSVGASQAWCSPDVPKDPAPFCGSAAAEQMGTSGGSVTLPRRWGKGPARLWRSECVSFKARHHFAHLTWCVSVFTGKNNSSRRCTQSPHDAEMWTTLPKKALFFSSQRSCIFFNSQRDMFGTNVVSVAGNIWARSFGPEKVRGWGWVCRKCSSLAQSHCHTCKISSSCVGCPLHCPQGRENDLHPSCLSWRKFLLYHGSHDQATK